MRDAGLEQAIRAAGGISALARQIGVAQPSVSNWSRVPAERVLAVEAITAVPRGVLRPDLYPASEQDSAEVDPIDEARGRLYLLLASVILRVPKDETLAELARMDGTGDGEIASALAAVAQAARLTDGEALAREHFDLFVGVGRGELLPYASYYLTGFLYERPLVRVREDLAVLGLRRDEDVAEPEDNVGFLCEVMAGLALGRFAAAEPFHKRFFERNLAPFAARFFSDLEQAPSARFYRSIGRLGRIFMELEREAFALELDTPASNLAAQHSGEGIDERQAS